MVNLMTSLQSIINSLTLVRWVTFLLVIFLAWQVGQSSSLLLKSPLVPELPVLSVQSTSIKTVEGERSYLMGKPDKTLSNQKPISDSKPVSEIANTRLKLKLLGVIDVEGAGVAIIQSSGQTLVVSEGEQIVKGVDLIEVYSDQVVISHRGKRERLVMEALTKGLIESSSVSSSSALSSNLTAENTQALKEVGETLRKSPISISKYIRFKPIGKNGSWSAVKIWPKSNADLFNSIGFKSGDLIKAVNGRTIQEMSLEPSLWQTFLNESQFELTIERQGGTVNLSVDLN